MKFITAMLAALMLSSSMTPVLADVEHPTFLQTAGYFLVGQEIPDSIIIKLKDGEAFQATKGNFGLEAFVWGPDNPCVVIVQTDNATYTINFDKFPGPNRATLRGGGRDTQQAEWMLSPEALTVSKGSIDPNHGGGFADVVLYQLDQIHMRFIIHMYGSVSRQLKALQYIRDNFCPGEPDPPQSPY